MTGCRVRVFGGLDAAADSIGDVDSLADLLERRVAELLADLG